MQQPLRGSLHQLHVGENAIVLESIKHVKADPHCNDALEVRYRSLWKLRKIN